MSQRGTSFHENRSRHPGSPAGFSGDRLQLRSAGRGKPTSTYTWGCTLEQPDTDQTFQNGREAMWPMIAEAGLRCDECRHTIQHGRLCLSEIPEEKPTGTNRTDFRNYCIGCPQCWAQGKHACYVRRLDRRSDTTGPTPRSLPCARCGRRIPAGEKGWRRPLLRMGGRRRGRGNEGEDTPGRSRRNGGSGGRSGSLDPGHTERLV